MEINSIDLLSKLMAKENLTVIRQKVPTASFDLKNRVLRLPMLVNMSQVEETMMGFHEVGHALFTGEEYITYIEAKKELKHFGAYMNVIEDVRIERILKDYYPGCRKDFYAGYKSLCERDFFGIVGRNVNEMGLIDRINLYFKVGYSSGVTFTKEEREFVVAAEKAETIEDVYDLAMKVYAFAAAQKNEAQKNAETGSDEFDFDFKDEDEDDEDMFGDADDEFEYKEEIEYNDAEKDDQAVEDKYAPKSATQDNFDEQMRRNTQRNDGYEVLYVEPTNYVEPKFIGFREIVKEFRENIPTSSKEKDINGYYGKIHELFVKFRSANNKAVSHLVKEFEMRKAAQRYSRTQTATTGSLSMSKIHKFKTSEDLFRKLDVVLDDKNHSFLMLLDWSGSMDNNLQDSIGQIITLASFCRRVNIPFQVCAFSDCRKDKYDDTTVTFNQPTQFARIDGDRINILNFLDSKMSNQEYEYMCEALFTQTYRRMDNPELRDKYELGGTPLIEALSWLYGYIDTFKKTTRCEKMTIITVTDGEGGGVNIKSNEGHVYRSQMFVRCPKTGKTYPAGDRITLQNSIMAAIKNSNRDIRFVGFYVAGGKRAVADFNRQNNNAVSHSEVITSNVRKNGYYLYPSPNYHKLFVIAAQNESVEVDMNAIKKDMTANQMARKMTSSMQAVIKGRVVLSKFIEEIS